MSKEFDVHYGEEEFKTVGSGIEAIQSVLMGEDIHAKERLLFYLDWYMDPYYEKDLSVIGDYKPFYVDLIHKAYTIGGMILFPQHPGSINQSRGNCCSHIRNGCFHYTVKLSENYPLRV